MKVFLFIKAVWKSRSYPLNKRKRLQIQANALCTIHGDKVYKLWSFFSGLHYKHLRCGFHGKTLTDTCITSLHSNWVYKFSFLNSPLLGRTVGSWPFPPESAWRPLSRDSPQTQHPGSCRGTLWGHGRGHLHLDPGGSRRRPDPGGSLPCSDTQTKMKEIYLVECQILKVIYKSGPISHEMVHKPEVFLDLLISKSKWKTRLQYVYANTYYYDHKIFLNLIKLEPIHLYMYHWWFCKQGSLPKRAIKINGRLYKWEFVFFKFN